jgi:hypothetical protein
MSVIVSKLAAGETTQRPVSAMFSALLQTAAFHEIGCLLHAVATWKVAGQ